MRTLEIKKAHSRRKPQKSLDPGKAGNCSSDNYRQPNLPRLNYLPAPRPASSLTLC